MGFILFTGKYHRAGFSILRPAPFRLSIAVTGGRNVCKHFGLCHCPISLKGSRIGGFAVLCTGRRFSLCACYRCLGCFRMSAVIFAGTGSSTGASVIAPCVNCIIPIVTDCADNPGILFDSVSPLASLKYLPQVSQVQYSLLPSSVHVER